MRRSIRTHARVGLVLVPLLLCPAPSGAAGDKARPSIAVKASPAIAFSPARVSLTADLQGGANDYEEFYCSGTEWDWGDGTRSQESTDCDPYQAGKSEIQRHFHASRTFERSGDYKVEFRLKKKDKTVAAGSTVVKIRPGVHEIGGGY